MLVDNSLLDFGDALSEGAWASAGQKTIKVADDESVTFTVTVEA